MGVRPLGDRGLGVDQLVDPLHTGPGLLADGQHHRQHPDRSDQLRQIGGEGDEGAEGDLSLGGHPAAEGQHRDLAERGDGLEGGGVAGVEADRAQPPGEKPAADLAQLPGLLLLLPEALDDAHPGDRAVHDTGHRGRLSLGVPGGGEEAGAAALGDEPQGGGDGQRDDGEQRRQHRHHGQRDREQQDVPDHHREHEEQALDQLEVAGGAADHLAGAELVLPAAVEPGDRAEHPGPQIVLEVQGELTAVEAADVGEDVDDERGHDHEGGPGAEGARLPDDDIVDDQLRYERDQGQHGHPGERGAEGQQHVFPVLPAVTGQPPRPARSFRVRPRHPVPPAHRHFFELFEGTNTARRGFHPAVTNFCARPAPGTADGPVPDGPERGRHSAGP